MPSSILDNMVRNVASATIRSVERRNVRIAKNTAESWRIVWDDSIKEFYPECRITYATREAVNLKRMVASRGLPVDDLCNFLRWCVENWAKLRQNTFSNFPGKAFGPEQPDMKFLLQHIARVHADYQRSKPEVAAILPLAHRTGRVLKPVAAAPAPAKPRPAAPIPQAQQRPSASLLKPPTFNPRAAEAARVKLGIKKWDE